MAGINGSLGDKQSLFGLQTELVELAATAWGSREHEKGGHGHMGVLSDGRVVKFNTHWQERDDMKLDKRGQLKNPAQQTRYSNMMRSSDLLRDKIVDLCNRVATIREKGIDGILMHRLNLGSDKAKRLQADLERLGREVGNDKGRKHLDREKVATVVSKVGDYLDAVIKGSKGEVKKGVWIEAKSLAESTADVQTQDRFDRMYARSLETSDAKSAVPNSTRGKMVREVLTAGQEMLDSVRNGIVSPNTPQMPHSKSEDNRYYHATLKDGRTLERGGRYTVGKKEFTITEDDYSRVIGFNRAVSLSNAIGAMVEKMVLLHSNSGLEDYFGYDNAAWCKAIKGLSQEKVVEYFDGGDKAFTGFSKETDFEKVLNSLRMHFLKRVCQADDANGVAGNVDAKQRNGALAAARELCNGIVRLIDHELLHNPMSQLRDLVDEKNQRLSGAKASWERMQTTSLEVNGKPFWDVPEQEWDVSEQEEEVSSDTASEPPVSDDTTAKADAKADDVDLSKFTDEVNVSRDANRQAQIAPILSRLSSDEFSVRRNEVYEECFGKVFAGLMGELEGEGDKTARVKSDFPSIVSEFDNAWNACWDSSKAGGVLSTSVNKVLQQLAKDGVGSCSTEDLLANEVFKNGILTSVRASVGEYGLESARKRQSFSAAFNELKSTFKVGEMKESLKAHVSKERSEQIDRDYSDAQKETIFRMASKVFDDFRYAKSEFDLPPSICSLKERFYPKADDLKTALLDLAAGVVDAFDVKHANQKNAVASPTTLGEPGNPLQGNEMKELLGKAIAERKGIRQYGRNTCFIKSVVNSMIGTPVGQGVLQGLIRENGDYVFHPFDPQANAKGEITVTPAELSRARRDGFFTADWGNSSLDGKKQAYSGMDDLELAVWLALGKVHDNDAGFTERPGGVGEAGAVANLFGYKVIDENAQEGDLGAWVKVANTLHDGGLAVYHQDYDGKYQHFLSISGVTSGEGGGKEKEYRFVDSLSSMRREGIALSFNNFSNSVHCYEYVRGEDEAVEVVEDNGSVHETDAVANGAVNQGAAGAKPLTESESVAKLLGVGKDAGIVIHVLNDEKVRAKINEANGNGKSITREELFSALFEDVKLSKRYRNPERSKASDFGNHVKNLLFSRQCAEISRRTLGKIYGRQADDLEVLFNTGTVLADVFQGENDHAATSLEDFRKFSSETEASDAEFRGKSEAGAAQPNMRRELLLAARDALGGRHEGAWEKIKGILLGDLNLKGFYDNIREPLTKGDVDQVLAILDGAPYADQATWEAFLGVSNTKGVADTEAIGLEKLNIQGGDAARLAKDQVANILRRQLLDVAIEKLGGRENAERTDRYVVIKHIESLLLGGENATRELTGADVRKVALLMDLSTGDDSELLNLVGPLLDENPRLSDVGFLHLYDIAMEKFGEKGEPWKEKADTFVRLCGARYDQASREVKSADVVQLLKWSYLRNAKKLTTPENRKAFLLNELRRVLEVDGNMSRPILTALGARLDPQGGVRVDSSLINDNMDPLAIDKKTIRQLKKTAANSPATAVWLSMVTGELEATKLKTEMQQAFLKRDMDLLAAFKKANHGGDTAIWQWEMATKPEYQWEAMDLFGDDYLPVEAESLSEAFDLEIQSQAQKSPKTKSLESTSIMYRQNPVITQAAPTPQNPKPAKTKSYPSYDVSEGMHEVLVKHGKYLCQPVCGDVTNWQGFPTVSTQEECTLQCVSPGLQACMIAKGYVIPKRGDQFQSSTYRMYKYALGRNGLAKVNSMIGFAVKAHMITAPLGKTAADKPREFTLVFSSSVSYDYGASRDQNGFATTLYHHYQTMGEKSPFIGKSEEDTAKMLRNAMKFYNVFCDYGASSNRLFHTRRDVEFLKDKCRGNYGVDPDRLKVCNEALFVLTNLIENVPWNLFADDSEGEVDKFLDFIESGEYLDRMPEAIQNDDKALDWRAKNAVMLEWEIGRKSPHKTEIVQPLPGGGVFKARANRWLAHYSDYAIPALAGDRITVSSLSRSSSRDKKGKSLPDDTKVRDMLKIASRVKAKRDKQQVEAILAELEKEGVSKKLIGEYRGMVEFRSKSLQK